MFNPVSNYNSFLISFEISNVWIISVWKRNKTFNITALMQKNSKINYDYKRAIVLYDFLFGYSFIFPISLFHSFVIYHNQQNQTKQIYKRFLSKQVYHWNLFLKYYPNGYASFGIVNSSDFFSNLVLSCNTH